MKKIFALVLSLCLVLSSFVAVSAAELVYNEGVYVEGTQFTEITASAGSDFENGVGEMFVGNSSTIATAATVDGRNALKVDYSATNDHTNVIGFQFKDTAGNTVDLYGTGSVFSENAVINWSIDVRMDDITTAAPTLTLRDGTNPPSGQSVNLKSLKTETNGEWVTYSGTKKVSELTWAGNDATYTNLTVRFYPSAAGTMYIDNMTATVTDKSYYNEVIDIDAPLDDASEITWTTKNVTVSNADGIGGRDKVVKATGVANNNDSTVGMVLSDSFAFQAGDVLKYSVDLYTTQAGTPNLWIRDHSDLNPFNSNFKPAIGTWAANTWRTIEYECAYEDFGSTGWDSTGKYALYVRADGLGDVYLDNFKITVERPVATEDVVQPGWQVEPGWVDVDKSIDFVASKNATANPGTLTGNVYTATMDEFEAFYNNGNCSYNPWVKLDTNIPVGTNFKLSYDLTTEGINNSVGNPYATLTVRARFYNASNVEINSGYKPNAAVTVNTGEAVHYELDVDPTQLTQDVASVRIVVDVDSAAKNAKSDEGAYLTISNWELTKTGTMLDYEADGADLKITNNNAEKYKFTGRVFFAEYDGNELIQFYAAGNVAQEIAAGSSVTVENGFENAVSKTLKIFVWETDSMVPAMDVIE